MQYRAVDEQGGPDMGAGGFTPALSVSSMTKHVNFTGPFHSSHFDLDYDFVIDG